jgi:hypothetical protein
MDAQWIEPLIFFVLSLWRPPSTIEIPVIATFRIYAFRFGWCLWFLYFSAKSQWIWTAFLSVDKYGMPWREYDCEMLTFLANNQMKQGTLLYRTMKSCLQREGFSIFFLFSLLIPFFVAFIGSTRGFERSMMENVSSIHSTRRRGICTAFHWLCSFHFGRRRTL